MAIDNAGTGFFSKSNDLRNRILFTILILSIYRLGTYIPLPGIDPESLKTLLSSYKIPKEYIRVSNIPRNELGKIEYRKII